MSFINWKSRRVDKEFLAKNLSHSPDLMLKLSETIIKVHRSKGKESPLTGALAAELASKVAAIREKHDEGMKYMRLGREVLAQRDVLLGIRPGEKEGAPTLKYYLSCVFEILSPHLAQDKKSFAEWGFEKE
jgi:hypothetical protein